MSDLATVVWVDLETGYCNYGPEACGTNGQSPNDDCWSNCDAKAECDRFADPPNKECPLNVCCSQCGFCGMTEDFCRVTDDEEESCQSNCIQPGSVGSGGDVQKRVIGYYEAWIYKKKCIGTKMEDIPVNSLTHIYYSFAYIRPETYKIIPMSDERDGDLTTETFTEFILSARIPHSGPLLPSAAGPSTITTPFGSPSSAIFRPPRQSGLSY
jgi:chitinase